MKCVTQCNARLDDEMFDIILDEKFDTKPDEMCVAADAAATPGDPRQPSALLTVRTSSPRTLGRRSAAQWRGSVPGNSRGLLVITTPIPR